MSTEVIKGAASKANNKDSPHNDRRITLRHVKILPPSQHSKVDDAGDDDVDFFFVLVTLIDNWNGEAQPMIKRNNKSFDSIEESVVNVAIADLDVTVDDAVLLLFIVVDFFA